MSYDVTENAVMQLQFEGRHFGQQVMTVMTYILTDSASIDGPSVFGEVLLNIDGGGTDLYNRWIGACTTDITDVTIAMQWIAPVRYSYQLYFGALTAGQLDPPTMPPNVAQTCTRRAFNTGRSTISNLKLPGVPIAGVADGYLTNAQVTRLGDFASASKQEMLLSTGGKLVPITYHRSAPSLGEKLVFAHPHNTVRTMHRRTVGVGS